MAMYFKIGFYKLILYTLYRNNGSLRKDSLLKYARMYLEKNKPTYNTNELEKMVESLLRYGIIFKDVAPYRISYAQEIMSFFVLKKNIDGNAGDFFKITDFDIAYFSQYFKQIKYNFNDLCIFEKENELLLERYIKDSFNYFKELCPNRINYRVCKIYCQYMMAFKHNIYLTDRIFDDYLNEHFIIKFFLINDRNNNKLKNTLFKIIGDNFKEGYIKFK